MRPQIKTRSRRPEAGNTMLEFALCSLVLVPVMLGVFTVGMNLARNLQVTHLVRNAGHMYVRSVDFSQPANQQLAVRLADGLRMNLAGGYQPDPAGRGAVVLTQVVTPTQFDCDAAGIPACANLGVPVIRHRIVIGNASLPGTVLGHPPANLIGSTGAIDIADYLNNTACRAQNFGGFMTLSAGEVAYIAEGYFASPDYDLGGMFADSGVYSRAVY